MTASNGRARTRPDSSSSPGPPTRRRAATIDALAARAPAGRDPHLLGHRCPPRPSPPRPALRVVARMGVGLDNIDVAAATDRGVLVTNVPDYCVEEVSDHAVGLVLAHDPRAWSPPTARSARAAGTRPAPGCAGCPR